MINIKKFSKSALILLPFLSISLFPKEVNAALDAVGTIDFSNRIITLDGSINSNDNIINANLLDVPSGEWTIEKYELNDTSESWFGWEINFSDNVLISLNSNVSSNLFNQISIFPDDNRIVFFDGEVMPGELLNKSFELELSETETSQVLSM